MVKSSIVLAAMLDLMLLFTPPVSIAQYSRCLVLIFLTQRLLYEPSLYYKWLKIINFTYLPWHERRIVIFLPDFIFPFQIYISFQFLICSLDDWTLALQSFVSNQSLLWHKEKLL